MEVFHRFFLFLPLLLTGNAGRDILKTSLIIKNCWPAASVWIPPAPSQSLLRNASSPKGRAKGLAPLYIVCWHEKWSVSVSIRSIDCFTNALPTGRGDFIRLFFRMAVLFGQLRDLAELPGDIAVAFPPVGQETGAAILDAVADIAEVAAAPVAQGI